MPKWQKIEKATLHSIIFASPSSLCDPVHLNESPNLWEIIQLRIKCRLIRTLL